MTLRFFLRWLIKKRFCSAQLESIQVYLKYIYTDTYQTLLKALEGYCTLGE